MTHKRLELALRAEGGGRRRLVEKIPELVEDLKCLVEDTTCGDPGTPLLWTCKSTRQLSQALNNKGYKVGRQTVSE
jgi:hypothetical protein